MEFIGFLFLLWFVNKLFGDSKPLSKREQRWAKRAGVKLGRRR